MLGQAYRIFIILLLFSLGLAAKASELESHRSSSDSDRPSVEHPSEIDLKIYLEVLEARENILEQANEALLKEAEYSVVKIPLFMAKAAIDGYFFGKTLVGGGTQAAAAQTVASQAAARSSAMAFSHQAQQWVASGGLSRMRTLGFNVGVMGISAANNTLLLPGYRWQYGVPIYGTAYSAYLWSEQLMNSPELIEKNGKEILSIRKEKFRVRNLLQKN